MTHSPEILQLDTVRAYHSGPRLIIEVDVVMDPDCTLKHSHDIAEELQMKLESLPDVERAYVHIDYETTHSPVCDDGLVVLGRICANYRYLCLFRSIL
jgi:divalent metal cation (Fe/Co/Zn/Cd) transporter